MSFHFAVLKGGALWLANDRQYDDGSLASKMFPVKGDTAVLSFVGPFELAVHYKVWLEEASALTAPSFARESQGFLQKSWDELKPRDHAHFILAFPERERCAFWAINKDQHDDFSHTLRAGDGFVCNNMRAEVLAIARQELQHIWTEGLTCVERLYQRIHTVEDTVSSEYDAWCVGG